ncbi:fumarylacetoacetate hydrolase family protein [Williamsia sp. M5A3_1d]
MKLTGVTVRGERWVAAVVDGNLWPLASVDDFWTDPYRWIGAAPSSAPSGRAGEAETTYLPDRARVVCVGLNYRAHAAEGAFEVPEYPTLFGRWTASLTVDHGPVTVPADELGLDWEGELAAIIGSAAADVDETEAAERVLGYAVFNDLTARRAQKLTTQWTLGKNADLSGPTGRLVTSDECGDPASGWALTTRVNGVTVQSGNTRDMIFSVPTIISLISRTLTLQPGDMIVTGTPHGVGYVRDPPWLLGPGDTVEVTIDHLGTLTTPVVERPRSVK